MDLLLAPLALLVLFGPVVVIALLANRAQRRSFEAMVPRGPVAATSEPRTTEVDMVAAASPLRLGAVRSVACGLILIVLPAVLLTLAGHGLTRGQVTWFVVAGHATLSVAAASVAERWAALRARPLTGAALAGAAALVITGAGMFQAEATAEVLLGGGSPDRALGALEELLRDPARLGETLAPKLLLLTCTWAFPCAAITYGQLNHRADPVPAAAVLTVCTGLPAILLLTSCYLVASIWTTRSRAGGL